MKILSLLLLVVSCGTHTGGSPKVGTSSFNFKDVSGSYRLVRETKFINKKLVSRLQLLSTTGGGEKLVEKSIVVSQLGSIKAKRGRTGVIRPLASEFTVWLEGKKYSSRQNLNVPKKSMKVTTSSPEPKLNGVRDVRFPPGRFFCYFSQIPECLHQSRLLELSVSAEKRPFNFYVVWDSFPYTTEQYTNLSGDLFAPASVTYDRLFKGQHRFEVEVEGQMILYYFSKSFEFAKMSWIAQGVTISSRNDE